MFRYKNEEIKYDENYSFMTLNIKKYFWILYGFLVFIPFEFFFDGLFFAYFQGVLLLFLSRNLKAINLALFSLYLVCILISVSLGSNPMLVSLINPIMIGAILISGPIKQDRLLMIKHGIYISALCIALYLVFLFSQKGFDSIASMMINREWASENIVFFGNGLALMFSITMLFALKDRNYILLFIFFIGGLLTTSRMPIITMLVILFSLLIKSTTTEKLSLALLVGLILALGGADWIPSAKIFDGLGSLYERAIYTEDRLGVYNQALNVFYENPFFGIGSEKLFFYDHAHNSYLQIASKFGFFALSIFLVLLYINILNGVRISKDWVFLLVFFICTISQVALLSPNFLITIKIFFFEYLYIRSTNKNLQGV